MPWPVPTASTIAERIASALEAAISRLRPEVDPLALSRSVRSAQGNLAQISRATALELREVQDHISWWARQYFPDTAEDEFADRHASMWGLSRRPATHAIGTVLIEGTAGTALPAALDLVGSNSTVFQTTEPASIGGNGTVLVAVRARDGGPEGNVEPGIQLRVLTAFPDVRRVTVSDPGLRGGAAEELFTALAGRTVERIRQRAHGGAAFDYPTWLAETFDVRAVAVVPEWIGRGSVGVVVAMHDGGFGRTPTPAEVEAMQIHLGRFGVAEGVRPVTARVVVVAAEIVPVSLTVRLRPDTLAVRAAVKEAWERFITTLGDPEDEQNLSPIGAKIERSRVSEAISGAAGEYAHDLVLPAATLQLGRAQYPVPAAPSFAS